ncbi:MAG: helix-turn-helix domain-containing protein [Clostridia bacterium]|nr:helix-turn-helix domain-containing protein [Clostridia bacterium]
MWDWELLKHNSGKHRYHILSSYKNEEFQYTHSISHGTQEDEFCLHNHAMYELEYYLSGDVVYMVDGVRYEMQPGSLLLIGPTVPHKLFINSDTSFERHILYVSNVGSKSSLADLAGECLYSSDGQRIGSAFYAPEAVADMKDLLHDFGRCAASDDKHLKDLAPIFAQAVLAKLKMKARTQKPTLYSVGEDRTMDTVKEYLSRNLTRDISLQDIADRFKLSRDYCNRLFHKNTGMSIMQYVKYNRVLFARQLLADGVAASEAAERAGFKDYSSFYRAYRAITGRMPSEDYQIAESEGAPETPPTNFNT